MAVGASSEGKPCEVLLDRLAVAARQRVEDSVLEQSISIVVVGQVQRFDDDSGHVARALDGIAACTEQIIVRRAAQDAAIGARLAVDCPVAGFAERFYQARVRELGERLTAVAEGATIAVKHLRSA